MCVDGVNDLSPRFPGLWGSGSDRDGVNPLPQVGMNVPPIDLIEDLVAPTRVEDDVHLAGPRIPQLVSYSTHSPARIAYRVLGTRHQ